MDTLTAEKQIQLKFDAITENDPHNAAVLIDALDSCVQADLKITAIFAQDGDEIATGRHYPRADIVGEHGHVEPL